MIKNRDSYVDFLRGFAMLLVVLGHTMTSVTINSQSSVLFNIVWSLQIPMFILISGYVTRYSRKANNIKGLFTLFGRRTVSYLLPWAIWTFFIRGLILGHFKSADYLSLLWNMDSGYWFLVTLWTITVIFEFSRFISKKITNKQAVYIIVTGIFYAVGFGLLTLIGKIFGFSFFAIKLTLYYMPYYFAGFIFGELKDKLFAARFGKRICQIIVAVCAAVWVVFIVKFDLYGLSEGIGDIILRVTASVTGCVAVFGLLKAVYSTFGKVSSFFVWCGINSLEIYLMHNCFLGLIKASVKPGFLSAKGLLFIAVNYIATVIITVVCVKLLKSNPYTDFLLFGKKKKTINAAKG